MNRFPTLRLAAFAALAAGLLLSGCGRKGPLDLPPGAAAAVPQDAAPPAAEDQRNLFGEPLSDTSKPAGAVGPKRRMPMDGLLN